MSVVAQADLDLAVHAILAQLEASAIVLFGSRARGDEHPDSDLDLLVIAPAEVMQGSPRYELSGRIYRALADLPMGVDLLLYSREEVEARRDSLNHVIAHALREGKVLHGRL